MKKYYITSLTTVYQDHFEEGEGDYVNEFQNNSVIHGENALDAVKTYFDKILFFSFDESCADIEDSQVRYSTVVDYENCEVLQNDKIFEKFKKNEVILYAAYTSLTVFELVEAKIK